MSIEIANRDPGHERTAKELREENELLWIALAFLFFVCII